MTGSRVPTEHTTSAGSASAGRKNGGPRVGLIMEQCLTPVPGGTGRYTREIASALVAAAPAGATVTGWTAWHRDVEPARVPGVRGPRRLPLPRRGVIAVWDAGVGPAPGDVDLIHAPTMLAPPKPRQPLVVTIHDAVPWTHPQTLTPRGVAWHRRAGARAAGTADAIVVPSQAVADELSDLLPLGDRVHVVPHGVTGDLTPPADADERAARMALPEGGYLMSLATLEPRKGLDVLVAALADSAAPDLPLLVVGQPGWGGVDVAALRDRFGLAPDRVRVMGRLSDADLAVVLSRATVLAAPSRAEGFGLPVLEAMAAGVPVVHSDAAALVEVGGGATVVVPKDQPRLLAEGLRGVVDDAELRVRLSEAGLARASQYTWEHAARQLWGLYLTLTGFTPGGRA